VLEVARAECIEEVEHTQCRQAGSGRAWRELDAATTTPRGADRPAGEGELIDLISF